ncbi:MAG: LysM peptidoglycan-binding domain-containing protein [Actinobacteria bacterium]|nr:LysM peptidoglycan-binding domain-containing protein [Actinomycetota bacterium]
MAEAKSGTQSGKTPVRTAGETQRAGTRRAPTRTRPSADTSRRRRDLTPSPTGHVARLLAPVALVICAIAVFSVLSSGSDTTTKGAGDGSKSATSGQSDSSGSGSSDSGKGDTTTESGEVVPAKATYKVKPGDSFAAIAEQTGVDVDKLAELNPDVDPRALQPGQKLKLK